MAIANRQIFCFKRGQRVPEINTSTELTILAIIRRKFSTPPVVAFKFPEEYLSAKKVGHISATFRVLNFGTGIPESSECKDLPMRLFSSSVINLEEIEIRVSLCNGHHSITAIQ